MKTKKKVFISNNPQISTKSEVKTKKQKVFIPKNARITINSGMKSQKQTVFIAKSPQKTVLAHELWGDDQYFESLQASKGTPAAQSLLISFGHNPRLGEGHNSLLGGTSRDLGGTAPECAPVARSLITRTFQSTGRKGGITFQKRDCPI